MSTITVQEIQSDPGAFVQRLEQGEELLVLRGDRTVAHVQPVPNGSVTRRPYGLAAGEFTLPEDFDAPLPEQILSDFEGV